MKSDNTVLEPTTYDYVQSIKNDATTGKPNMYYIRDNTLYTYPEGGTTVELRYQKSLPSLSSSQDSELPDTCDDLICLFAAYKLFL